MKPSVLKHNSDQTNWFAVIVAGGSGKRFGGPKPKQFLKLNYKPVLKWSVDCFFSVPGLTTMVIVTHKDWISETSDLFSGSPFKDRIIVTPGGKQRQDSCRLGLLALNDASDAPVLIHDAARPWVTSNLVTSVLNIVRTGHCVIPIVKATDSIVSIDSGIVQSYPDRSNIGYVQTPQGFPLDLIRDLHLEVFNAGQGEFTDDGSLALSRGYPVLTVDGESSNRKITHKDDSPDI